MLVLEGELLRQGLVFNSSQSTYVPYFKEITLLPFFLQFCNTSDDMSLLAFPVNVQ